MRYWVRDGKDARGPFTLEELAAQGTPDSALVCPENRPKSRRENWLPLRRAAAPPRFYARIGSKVRGPYAAEELARLHGFSPDTLLCPEGRNFRSRWNWGPARSSPAFRPAQARAAPAAERRIQPASEALGAARRWWEGLSGRWSRPRTVPLLAASAALMAGVLLWLHFAYLPEVRQTYHRVHTVMGLRVIAALQERYRYERGAYSPDFDSLVEVAGPWLPELMSENLDLETLMVKGSSDSFKIEANARDDRRTLYHFMGRVPGARKTARPPQPSAEAVTPSTGTAR
jgi:hypothetical protein